MDMISFQNKPLNKQISQFFQRLAQIDLRISVLVLTLIGVFTIFYGIWLEVHGQAELLQQHGIIAVDSYNSLINLYPVNSFISYVNKAFAGELPSFGGNVQGIGIGIIVIGPVAGALSILFARFTIKKLL